MDDISQMTQKTNLLELLPFSLFGQQQGVHKQRAQERSRGQYVGRGVEKLEAHGEADFVRKTILQHSVTSLPNTLYSKCQAKHKRLPWRKTKPKETVLPVPHTCAARTVHPGSGENHPTKVPCLYGRYLRQFTCTQVLTVPTVSWSAVLVTHLVNCRDVLR